MFMKKSITIFLLLVACVSCSFAQKARIRTDINIFGVAVSVTDSVVIMTDLQQIGKVEMEKKTKFISDRDEYSRQLYDYVKKNGEKNMIALVSYDLKKPKLEKKYLKIKQRYTKDGFVVKYITKEDFVFVPVALDESGQ